MTDAFGRPGGPGRVASLALAALLTCLLTACDLWPRDLDALAESISQQLGGQATAWLVGGDIVVISVEGSPVFERAEDELEAVATGLAEQALAASPTAIEAVTVTFYRNDVTDPEAATREFIFLVLDGRPVLEPGFDDEATGPLTDAEIQASVDGFDEVYDGPDDTWTPERRACVLAEAQRRARAAGDPETLDPSTVVALDTVPMETWNALEPFGRRLFLAQAVTTEALFACVSD